ncbi:MAG: FHA domain-containing protein [Leptolyngbya sp. PLA3]|nr:MAG: FHA domain-containing protein [Cyanobacteria bacterium CYA]MCE7967256.1 FHA domain-containing protein [Leptolyngbya sp. PL-A3]
MPEQPLENLRLEPIAGPATDPIDLSPPGPRRVGRGSENDVQLVYATVSREHALFVLQAGQWMVVDRQSRHGSFLNGVQLPAGEPTPLAPGDLIRFGPWTFRIRDPRSVAPAIATTNDFHSSGHRIETIQRATHHEFAQHRLDLILECAASANAAASVPDLARVMLDTALQGTGFGRGAVVRQVSASGEVEMLAHAGPGMDNELQVDISRSLLAAASAGEIVRLTSEARPDFGQSIVDLGIHSAICAPLMLERSVEAYLYLDARRGERAVAEEAAAFCAAIARIGEMAIGNLRRGQLERQRREMEREMQAAREVQDVIMPADAGSGSFLRYALARRPGRFVAGDLFDFVLLDDDTAAAFLGDVAGKGISAALLMTIAQTYLRCGLRVDRDPGAIVTDLNQHVFRYSAANRFLSLWLGVFDREKHELSFVDAGHGHWLVVRPGEKPAPIRCAGGLLVGVQEGQQYQTERISLPPGSRLVVFSDGLIEQHDRLGVQFGVARAIDSLAGSTSAETDVRTLAQAVVRHAGTDALGDDLTIASIEVVA